MNFTDATKIPKSYERTYRVQISNDESRLMFSKTVVVDVNLSQDEVKKQCILALEQCLERLPWIKTT